MSQNHTSEQEIIGYTVRQAERIEQMDSIDELHILEVEYTVSDRGNVTGVDLVTTCGGPTITVEAMNGVVRGTWGGDSHRTHVDSQVLEQYGKELARQFEARVDQ